AFTPQRRPIWSEPRRPRRVGNPLRRRSRCHPERSEGSARPKLYGGCMRRFAILVVATLFVADPAQAQIDSALVGPRTGTWGGETSFGSSASLLKFRTPSSAWLIGVSTFLSTVSSSGGSGTDAHVFFADLRSGMRFYGGAPTDRLRPLMTLAA